MSSHPGDELGTSPLARDAFESLESMLEPSVLGALIGRAVASVRREPFETSGWSSTEATFERIVVDGGDAPGLVVKIVDRARDWLAITSEDAVDREVRVWEMELLDRLPPPMSHAVIACSRGGSGYAVLMHDVSEFLFASDETVSMDDQPIVLDAVAALHARFWMDPSLRSAELGLCTVRQVTSSLAPSVPARLRPIVGSIELLDAAEEGWATLRSLEPRFYDRLAVVAEDSRALEAALAEYPWTLARGDVRPPNVGIDRDRNRVVMLDWAIPACGPPALDLAWWLFSSYTLVDSGVDPIVAIYREALERHRGVPVEDEWWAPSFGLSALSLMSTLAPFIATYQREMLPWWMEQAERGQELIG